MKVVAYDEVGGVATLTVRRWRWFRFVTDSWMSDGKRRECDAFRHLLEVFCSHRRWYRSLGGLASCGLCLRLDDALDDERRAKRLRDRIEQHYNDIVNLDDVRRRRAK